MNCWWQWWHLFKTLMTLTTLLSAYFASSKPPGRKRFETNWTGFGCWGSFATSTSKVTFGMNCCFRFLSLFTRLVRASSKIQLTSSTIFWFDDDVVVFLLVTWIFDQMHQMTRAAASLRDAAGFDLVLPHNLSGSEYFTLIMFWAVKSIRRCWLWPCPSK